jgi:ketosteroid isomerase-like protein
MQSYQLESTHVTHPVTHDLKALTGLYMQRFAAKDLDGVMALFHPDAGFEDPTVGRLDGTDAIRAAFGFIFQSFATLGFEARNLYQDNQTVVLEFVITADHLRLTGTDIIDWDGDRIRELRAYLDMPK